MTIGMGTVIILFFALMLIAIPIGSSLGIVSLLLGLFDPTAVAGGEYVVRSMVYGIDSFPLLAVPMFVLSGIIMARGGISKRLFKVFIYFLGNRTAGVPCAVVVTCMFYGAISGSAPATVAAVGSMTIPILIQMGYDKTFSTAVVAVAGGLGVIIPPSIPFILYGTATGASVGKMFVAGILPGILIALILCAYAIVYCKRKGEDRETINFVVDELKKRGFLSILKESIWALLCPVIILGCIYTGIASPTEAAVISVVYSLIVSLFIYKSLKWKELWSVLVEAVRTYTPILFILAASNAFSRLVALQEMPQAISDWIFSSFHSKIAILLIINLLLLFIGTIMDTSAAILIIAPILAPIAGAVGVDPIHFGIIMVVNLAIGFVTPPIGINLFVASSMSGVPMMSIAKKAMPMILCFLVALLLITFIPSISMALVG